MQDESRLLEIEARLQAVDAEKLSPELSRLLQDDMEYLLSRVKTQGGVLKQFWEILHQTREKLDGLTPD